MTLCFSRSTPSFSSLRAPLEPRQKRLPLPRYVGNERPPHLRTADKLHTENLRQEPAVPVALWHVVMPNRYPSGLHDRRTAVPVEAWPNAEAVGHHTRQGSASQDHPRAPSLMLRP